MKKRTSVLWTEKAEFPVGWGIRNHRHEYYHLFYVIEGKGTFIINNMAYEAVPKTCFLIKPDTYHELQKVEENALISYEIKFEINDEELISHLDLDYPMFAGNGFLDTVIPIIVSNGRSKTDYYIQNTDSLLSSLLVYLTTKTDDDAPNSELIDTTGFHPATVSAIDFIEHYYMDHIYLDDIAEHVDYNRNYLCSVFKNDTNITIVDYLNYVRIRKACEYISYSDIDMQKICYRVGFTNPSHFNRTFKKFVGMAPTVFSKLYPVDIDGNPINRDTPSGIENQILSVAEALGTLYHPKKD